MDYKVTKYKKKRKCPFETYEPERKIQIKKEEAVPFLIRTGHFLSGLGGLISFWAASGLMIIRGVFGVGNTIKKVRRFSLNNKVVEIRIKKNK